MAGRWKRIAWAAAPGTHEESSVPLAASHAPSGQCCSISHMRGRLSAGSSTRARGLARHTTQHLEANAPSAGAFESWKKKPSLHILSSDLTVISGGGAHSGGWPESTRAQIYWLSVRQAVASQPRTSEAIFFADGRQHGDEGAVGVFPTKWWIRGPVHRACSQMA